MKTYIQPSVKIVEIQVRHTMLSTSGVETGGSLKNNFYRSDATYSKEDNFWDEWDD